MKTTAITRFSQSALKWAFAGLKNCVFGLKTRVENSEIFHR